MPHSRPLGPRQLAAMAALLASLSVTACSVPDFMSFPPQTRGNKVDTDQLAQLVPGTSSRADALSLLGSPTARGTFDDNTWIYIGEVTKPVIGGTLSVRDQQVVVLTFDQGGVLRGVEKRGQNDSVPVAVVDRTTPSPGNNATVLQQLLGNVGRFSPSPVAQTDNRGPSGVGNSNNF